MTDIRKQGRRKLPPAAVSHADDPHTHVAPANIVEALHEAAEEHQALVAGETPVVDFAPQTITTQAEQAVIAEKETIMDATTTVNKTQDKAQAMFADVTERSKGAVEKSQKLLAELAEFGKGNVEALVESSKIAARGFETMGQDAAAYAKTSFEGATQAMRTLATVKSPTEFMKLQADYARTAFDALIAHNSRSTEASLKLAGEVAQPLSNRVAVAAEKIKVAA